MSLMKNLFRCLLSAGLTAVINPILNGSGIGWTFPLLGCLCLALTPAMTLWVIKIGPSWRSRRLLASR